MKKKNYHHGSLKEDALKVALSIIEKKGVEDLTLRQIAQHLGTSATALYRHFEDKISLLAAIAEQGFLNLLLKVELEIKEKNAKKKLKLLALCYLDFATEHSGEFLVMFDRELSDRSAFPLLQSNASRLVEILKQILKECEIIASHIDEEAFFFWAQIHGLAMLILNKQIPKKINLSAFVQSQIDLLMKKF